ncbi:MAG: hypothetical protein F2942_10585 [Actinobacteria bacterium]|uniref:Unannotated protein n=1 Tax=freshwater metagenome TaxID=449393 RepID=A0A6J7UTK7_9ZZZZ|nr:hypothetical protein [Actinomycetota bacterium]
MNVSTLIFLGLAVVWAIVLLPEVLRKLSVGRRTDSIRSFNHQLSVLNRSGNRRGADLPGMPRPVSLNSSSPRASSNARNSSNNVIDLRDRSNAPAAGAQTSPAKISPSVRRRRQDVLVVLGAIAVLTLLCTVAFGSVFLVPFMLSAALLVGYVFLLNQANQSAGMVQQRAQRSGLVPASSLPSSLQTSTVGRATPAPRRVAN